MKKSKRPAPRPASSAPPPAPPPASAEFTQPAEVPAPAAPAAPAAPPDPRVLLATAGALLGMILVVFGGILIAPGDWVPSRVQTDIGLYFLYWRDFAFSELRRGNLALWNPYIYSGAPFLGGFQAAPLYPVNWIYLVLPLGKAVNVEIIANLFLAGFFTQLWAAARNLHPGAGLLASIIVVFGGPYYLHVFAGHLPILASGAWAPLTLMAVDRIVEDRPRPRWILAGMAGVAMQIAGGNPQYVFYTGIACGALWLFSRGNLRSRLASAGSLTLIFAGGALLAAGQLAAGYEAGVESTRGEGGLPFEAGSFFSLPPVNLLTMLAPWFLGLGEVMDIAADPPPYWGRYYFWEMAPFLGVTTLPLAAAGLLRGGSPRRWAHAGVAAVFIVIALGKFTPLYRLLYEIPGFDRFRGPSKAFGFAAYFIALLAAAGFDSMLRRKSRDWIPAAAAGALLLVALGTGFAAFASKGEGSESFIRRIMTGVAASGESYLPPGFFQNPVVADRAAALAGRAMILAAFTAAAAGAIFWAAPIRPRAFAWAAAGLAGLELLVFAGLNRPALKVEGSMRPEHLEGFPEEDRREGRIFQLSNNVNQTMAARISNVWGYDPQVNRRYVEFMYHTQGLDPNRSGQVLPFNKAYHPWYRMLRCRRVFVQSGGTFKKADAPGALPRALFPTSHRVIQGRDAIFAAMDDPAFDPAREVVLETPPSPAPVASSDPGTARVEDINSDEMIVTASVKSPSILLLTDPYSRGWKAAAEGAAPQDHYEILPANYALKAIALAPGEHRIRLAYNPPTIRAGLTAMAAAWLAFAGAAAWLGLSAGRRKSLAREAAK